MEPDSTQPFWSMLILGPGVLLIMHNVTGRVDASTALAYFVYLLATVAVMTWDLRRKGVAKNRRRGAAAALVLFAPMGFAAWWFRMRASQDAPPHGPDHA